MKHVLLVLTALWALAAAAGAENHAKAALYARADGDVVKVAIEVRIDPGWHLYHGPSVEEMGTPGAAGKPTEVELTGTGLEFGEIRFATKPHAEAQDFGADEKHTIYEHSGTITIFALGTKTGGEADLETIRAVLTGQTCMDGPGGVCTDYDEEVRSKGAGKDELFATFAAIMDPAVDPTDPVPPESGASTGSNAGAGAVGSANASAGTSAPADPSSAAPQSLLPFLLSAVFWGLFTLLMPCTYPMIPITISYFTKQAEQRRTSNVTLSIVYGLGIVAIFVLIGLVIGQAIIPFAQHPVTNLVIGLVFVVFALSLFGLFNLQPPAFLMNAAGAASMKGGYLGVFLMGATLVVTSFTCTAPFVGALLGTGASTGSVGRIAIGMAVFGATIAIPFAGLSMLPGKAKSMPRSGEWMHTVKVTMGFVELAAALKFLSNSDLVWNWQFLSREMFLLLWLAIFATAALYLFGVIKLKDEATAEISPGRMVAGLFFALLSAYSLYGALGNKLDPIMTAIAPNYSNAEGAVIGHAGGKRGSAHVIVADDFEAAVARARDEKKRVLINFTGVT